MYCFRSLLAVLCCLLVLVPNLGAQTPGNQLNPPKLEAGGGSFSGIPRPYQAPDIPPIDLGNSNRLDSLLRAGKLYLSLQDTIALALENNLDISLQRYGPEIPDANLLRARAGGFLRGVSNSVQPGPTSATQTGPQTGINQSAAQQASSLQNSGNVLINQTGSPIPTLDPTIQGLMRWQHQSTPQTSTFVTGTNALFQRSG